VGSGGVRHWPRPARLCLRGYSLPSRQVSPSAFAPLQPIDSLANERPLAKQTALPGSRPFGADANEASVYLLFLKLLESVKTYAKSHAKVVLSSQIFCFPDGLRSTGFPSISYQKGPLEQWQFPWPCSHKSRKNDTKLNQCI
jgi:hypothetical protein